MLFHFKLRENLELSDPSTLPGSLVSLSQVLQDLVIKAQTRGLVPELFFSRQDKTRLEVTSQIAETETWLDMSGTVAQEISGKIWKKLGKFGTGLDYSVLLGKSLEWSWNELKPEAFLEIWYWTRNFLHGIGIFEFLAGLRQDWEEDVPKCSGREIF